MSGMNRDNMARLSISGPSVGCSGHLSIPLKKIHTRTVHAAVRRETVGNGIRK